MAEDEPKPIPDVAFAKARSRHGCDVLRLSDLMARRHRLKDPLDRPHRPLFHLLFLIHEGAGTHEVEFELLELRAPSVLIVPSGHVHRFTVPPTMDATLVLISNQALDATLDSVRLEHLRGLFHPSLTAPVLPLGDEAFADIQGVFRDMATERNREPSPDGPPMMAALLRLLLLRVSRCRTSGPPLLEVSGRLAGFLAFLRQLDGQLNGGAGSESLSRNAREHAAWLGISYKHLNAMCQEFAGQPAKRFIDERVVRESKRLLAATDLTVAEIAWRLGFEEPTNFGKFFKRHAAETPLAFRRRSARVASVTDLP